MYQPNPTADLLKNDNLLYIIWKQLMLKQSQLNYSQSIYNIHTYIHTLLLFFTSILYHLHEWSLSRHFSEPVVPTIPFEHHDYIAALHHPLHRFVNEDSTT